MDFCAIVEASSFMKIEDLAKNFCTLVNTLGTAGVWRISALNEAG